MYKKQKQDLKCVEEKHLYVKSTTITLELINILTSAFNISHITSMTNLEENKYNNPVPRYMEY